MHFAKHFFQFSEKAFIILHCFLKKWWLTRKKFCSIKPNLFIASTDEKSPGKYFTSNFIKTTELILFFFKLFQLETFATSVEQEVEHRFRAKTNREHIFEIQNFFLLQVGNICKHCNLLCTALRYLCIFICEFRSWNLNQLSVGNFFALTCSKSFSKSFEKKEAFKSSIFLNRSKIDHRTFDDVLCLYLL